MRREDPCPGLAPLLRMMSWRPAATTTPLASSGRGRALTRRMADYFGLSYPHEIHSRGLAPHSVDPFGGQLRTAGCCCNHPQTGSILNSKLSFRHRTNHRARRWHCNGYARRRTVRRRRAFSFTGHPQLCANVCRTRPRCLLGAGRQSPLQTDRV